MGYWSAGGCVMLRYATSDVAFAFNISIVALCCVMLRWALGVAFINYNVALCRYVALLERNIHYFGCCV